MLQGKRRRGYAPTLAIASALLVGNLALFGIACGSFGGTAEPTSDGGTPEAAAGDGAAPEASQDADAVACKGAVDCPRFVFVTSGVFPGDLGGVAGADAQCRAAAASSKLPQLSGRTFVAWLSTPLTTGGGDVKGRLVNGTAAYRLVDGRQVAGSLADFLDGAHDSAIELDENGAPVNANVWTGTKNEGTATTSTCIGFVSRLSVGTVGQSALGNGAWTNDKDISCTERAHLYCIEE